MKKNLIWVSAGFVLLGCILYFALRASKDELKSGYCAFCDPQVLDYQKFYEDDLVMVLYTHKPVMPGHSLIIPKRHVERFEMLTDDEITQIGRVIKKVNAAAQKVFGTSAYLILQKNGKEVGQQVPHVHFHYIPRKTGDDSTLMFHIKMYIANFSGPIKSAEMQETVSKMKKVMAGSYTQVNSKFGSRASSKLPGLNDRK